jgi:flagellar basal-body rod protein FlgB
MSDLLFGKRLFDRTLGLIQRSLDLRSARHRVLSSNIANSETPNFVSKDIPFQKILERAIDPSSGPSLVKTHPGHLSLEELSPGGQAVAVAEGVKIDEEMAKLAENNLRFQADVQALIKKLEGLRMVISEGR